MASKKEIIKENVKVNQLLFNYKSMNHGMGSLTVSMLWTEKIYLILHAVQLYCVAYSTFEQLWPRNWKKKFSSSYLSLSIGNPYIIAESVTPMSYQIRMLYSSFWLIIVLLILIVFFFLHFNMLLTSVVKSRLLRLLIRIIDCLYIPICLGLIPTALCQYDGCTFSYTQQFFTLLTTVICGVFALGYPLYLALISRTHTFSTNDDSEDTLRVKEIEYILGISKDWLIEKVYVYSSFKATWFRNYHKTIRCFLSLSLILILSIFRDIYSRASLSLLIALSYTAYSLLFPIYRCSSSNMLNILLNFTITANIWLAFLKASSDNKSQYLKGENFTEILWVTNLFSAVIISVLIVVLIVLRPQWPTNASEVQRLAVSYRYVLNDLRNSNRMILKLLSYSTFLFVRTSAIQEMLKILSSHYNLLSSERHPLQYTVVDQIDHLSHLLHLVQKSTLLPSQVLEESLSTVVAVVTRRWNQQILMSPMKRRLLLKILSLKMFLAHIQVIPFTSGIEIEEYEVKNLEVADETMITIEIEKVDTPEKYLMESGRQVRDIWFAVERKNLNRLIEMSERAVQHEDFDVFEELREGWSRIGKELMPLSLHERLFRDEFV